MLILEQAIVKLLAAIRPVGIETIPLTNLADRFLSENIAAPNPLPLFDNSAMDGWAVRSGDVTNASIENPIPLSQVAAIPAGQFFAGEIRPGQCARIFTGSPVPSGADAVVMQEDTRLENERVLILDPVKPWENIRFAGEDIKKNSVIANTGDRITPSLLGLLSACGISEARVFKQPRIAILATGNELRPPGQLLKTGEIYESNRFVVATLVHRCGAIPLVQSIVEDNLSATVSALRTASVADAIITCGGVSVGEYDFIKTAVQELKGNLEFWRVAIKPGKPFLHATLLGKPLFGLPGNPVSSLVTFWLLVRPALLKMCGAGDLAPPKSFGELAEEISNTGDRRHFIRVRLDAHGQVHSAGPQASHRLGSLAAANGLIDTPPGARWESGRKVEVLRLD